MRTRRRGVRDRDLCRGPGRLAAAFGSTGGSTATDLVRGTTVWLERGDAATSVVTSTRVGIRVATRAPVAVQPGGFALGLLAGARGLSRRAVRRP